MTKKICLTTSLPVDPWALLEALSWQRVMVPRPRHGTVVKSHKKVMVSHPRCTRSYTVAKIPPQWRTNVGLRTIIVFSISAISLRQEYSRSQAQMHIASVHQVR